VSEPAAVVVGGRYHLLSRLGSGGMGVVWLARDAVLGRQVAVKEIRQGWGSSEQTLAQGRERSRREARIAAALHHPGIVTVYDIIEHDGRPWIVMEFVSGRSLKDVVTEDGPLTAEATAEIGISLLSALRAAHAAGVTHRDVKPSNVLISDDGAVRLTDFGVATMQDADSLTETGAVLGTPGYLAPEQADGLPAGPAADVFGLAATLYYAIEGVGPFERDGFLPTLVAYARHDVRQPQRAGALGPALLRLLAMDPRKRPTAEQAEELLRGGNVRRPGRWRLPPVNGLPAWRAAASAFQLLGALFLLTVAVRRWLTVLMARQVHIDLVDALDVVDVLRPVGWAIVVVSALAGHRRVAAGAAVVAAGAEVARAVGWYEDSPSQVVRLGWLVVLALAVAGASGWLAGRATTARPGALWWIGAALGCALLADRVEFWHGYRSMVDPYPPGAVANQDDAVFLLLPEPLYVVAAGLAAWGWWRIGGPVRRRLTAFGAPAVTLAVLVQWGFATFLETSSRFPEPIPLEPVQWVLLGLTPVLTFAVAVPYLHRWERARLIRL
jgi:tRNA A-37 threonylcarbamoyl transferase component Bud32